MVLNLIDANKISFRESPQLKENRATTPIKSDCEKSPEIDTFDKQKNADVNSVTEKKGMSKRAKWLLGLTSAGALTIALFSLRPKKVSFEEVQKALSEIFEKDFSKEETEVLIKKYSEIYREKGSNTYYEKLIEQLKKDYGIENVCTNLILDNNTKFSSKAQICGESNNVGEIVLYTDVMKKTGKEAGFNILFHELKHVRQFSELWRADSELCIKTLAEDSLASNATQKIMKSELNNEVVQEYLLELQKDGMSKIEAENLLRSEMNKKFYKKFVNDIKDELTPVYQNLQKFEKDTPEYNKGINYLDSLRKSQGYNHLVKTGIAKNNVI